MFFLLLLILPGVRSQEATPASYLEDGIYQYQPYNSVQFVEPKPTKKGPILFPNDAPPPPPPPLIVTSRPLIESIARSELNPNNTHTAQSQLNQVSYRPQYLSRVKDYKPFAYALATVTPVYDFGPSQPYTDTVKVFQGGRRDNFYNEYENYQRSYYAKSRSERRIPYRKSENINGINTRHPQRKKYLSDENDRHPKIRHSNSLNYYDSSDKKNKNNKPISKTETDLLDNKSENRKRRPPDSLENLSDSIERYSNSRHIPKTNILNDNYYNNLKSRSSHPEDINDVSDRLPNRRLWYSQDSLSNSDNTETHERKPTYRTKHLSDNDHRVIKKRLLPNLNQSNPSDNTNTNLVKIRRVQNLKNLHNNNDDRILKRPLHNLHDLNDNDDKTQNLKRIYSHSADLDKPGARVLKWNPSQSLEHKIEIKDRNRKPSPLSSLENLNNVLERTTLKSIEHLSNSYERILRESPPHSAENLSENHGKVTQQKPSQSQESQSRNTHNEYGDDIQQRLIRPLYEPANLHKEQKTIPKQIPIKYQQRFETKNRYETQPTKSPDYNDYNNNEGDRDISKEYNQADNYAFSYTVKDDKTGDDFSHSQQSTGSATNGEYRVRLPDGRMQVVSYTADENGYKADVRYDDHHDDNSIDLDTSKENRNRIDLPRTYKYNDAHTYSGNIGRDSSYNRENLQYPYKGDKSYDYNNVYSKRPTYYSTIPKDISSSDDFLENTHANTNFDHKNDFTDTKKVLVNDHKSGALSENNNDYLDHYNDKESNDKVLRAHDDDDFQFTDEVADYSSELSQGYQHQPHKSKYSSFKNHKTVKSTVVPSYEELKDLFVTNPNGRPQNSALPVVSTVRPNYDRTAEDVVVIGGKRPNLYTNIRNIVPVTPAPLTYSTPFASTPGGYLLSTITNLKNQISLANKPVLSNQYIDKINKYLTYK